MCKTLLITPTLSYGRGTEEKGLYLAVLYPSLVPRLPTLVAFQLYYTEHKLKMRETLEQG